MELKKYFKLYKSGKQWISTAIITAAILLGMTMVSSVMADDSTMTDTPSTVNNINISQTDGEMQNVSSMGNTAEKLSSTINQTANVLDNSNVANESSPVNGWNSNHTEYYQNGQAANGYVQATDGNYYMFHNGVRQSGVQKWMGTYYYFDPTTYLRVDNDYREQIWQDGSRDWYMFGNNGQIVTGKYNWQGSVYYFDPSSYLKVVNDYRVTEPDGRGILLGNDGAALSGLQQWMGSYYYFDPVTKLRVDNDYRATENDGRGVLLGSNGIALSGLQRWMGTYYYFDPITKLRVDNDYREQIWQDGSHDWYMFGNNGQIVTGKYNWQGNVYYFDPSSYLKVVNDYRATESDGRGVLLGSDGAALSGVQQWMGTYYYFDPVTKLRVDNAYVKSQWGLWYMFGSNGQIVTGPYNWQGSTYYFDPSSYLRVENQFRAVNGVTHYFNDQGIMQDDSLVARWESLINGYQGHHIMIAVQSQKTGNIHEYTNTPGYRLITASTVKVAVLALLLHNTNGNLSAYQQQLAANMIRNSDNNATTTLINNYLGGTAGLQAIFSALGMNQTTTAANGHWAQTLTTATDQLKLLNEIFIKPQSDYLNENSRNYIKSLMSSVNPSQTWGISAGSSQYYIKNGWSALAAPWPWFVNSIGFIPGTNNDGYTIAVYTDNNLPMSVGVNMIESLARATKEMGVQ